jgi:hypothetical protein
MRRTILISLLAIPGLALAQSNKIDLFSFVMADAQLIAGANVDSAKNSTFGQFVLSQIPPDQKYLAAFMSQTGIDPRSDVTEVLAAWNGATNSGARWLIAAHGNFSSSIETIEDNAVKNGGAITRLAGVDLVEAGNSGTNPPVANLCIGLFTDGFTDVIGDCSSVQSAVGPASPEASSSLAMQAQQLRSQQDLWLVSVVPVTQFANLFAGANAGGMDNLGAVLKSNLFQAIQQVSGGVKFASTTAPAGAQFSAGISMNSPQDAASLLNVVNFIVGLLKPAWAPHRHPAASPHCLGISKHRRVAAFSTSV